MIVFENVCGLCKKKWERSQPIALSSIPKVNEEKQKFNETQFEQITKVFEHFEETSNIQQIDKEFRYWMKHNRIWNLSWLSDEEQEQFYQISKQFMIDAKEFDEHMRYEDIGQALRNVWIILILTKVFDRDLRYHKAIFAYSMLYPYTDNFLDDTSITKEEKKAFNIWLSKRLQGDVHTYEHPQQIQVDKLVHMIEEMYPRDVYPQVYDALLRIQEGQIKSLLQNDILDPDKILDISIEKGGASVFADGYLIDGTMSDPEAIFSVAFGFLLQLADDIQDLHDDRKANYHTLISTKKYRKERTRFCSAYLHFIEVVIHELCPSKNMKLKRFMIDNCRLLILFSLLKDAKYYSKMFMYRIRKRLPLQASYLRRMTLKFQDFKMNDTMQQQFDTYLQRAN